jgi:hypothetical protein
MRSGWLALRASVSYCTVKLTDGDQQEVERAIGAHFEWLISRDVELPGEPERLTAIDAFSVLEDAKEKGKLDDPSQAAAVLRSLMALCAFRTRAVGIEQVRASIEARWDERVKTAAKAARPQVRRERRAILAVHDDTQLKNIERRAALYQKDARSLLRALAKGEEATRVRVNAMFAAGFDAVAAPTAMREHLESIWLRGTIEHALAEVSEYLQRQRGSAASESLGEPGEATSRGWHERRAQCLLALEREGIRSPLRRTLFPSVDSDPERQRDVDRKRRARARKLSKTRT